MFSKVGKEKETDMDIVRLGDSTTHGGTVIEAFGETDLNGKPVAGVGHLVMCPLCKGAFPIVQGSTLLDVGGVAVALDGMKTACGAKLIASDPKGQAEF
ncbi:Zn-binding Pro-Ala-Ala-Arg (PAAR) domain-containing protein, incolved in TypeVI secretion [Pseudomonas sp. NFPP10]|nr:Zn-binding Pro-Ala-Ala-Arg (PAAR) domain-containing protein, incolved in TypeVI secretion [Pseudomonas sp. NFPP12]SEK37953.1 Zn-binding Pro-Ala-Ala-Arg (PAAR) domain-containing protein, incolved in TypeVI secretion [Pseudomonas sp. NFPP10]SFI01779.1 Zn-binding Pro-Ala-Ala-Arg (PAAR) domain-containing protein, incolved in TypeVI secretion [Pseudomonas sp. NFPP08]SFM18879.1 Zn-binding Pro-Ala-Ala-Arg (PAAR) domain-containing protein, incolved in TypeVI secretion [Pseudomonas sp. NFPP05]SFX0937